MLLRLRPAGGGLQCESEGSKRFQDNGLGFSGQSLRVYGQAARVWGRGASNLRKFL